MESTSAGRARRASLIGRVTEELDRPPGIYIGAVVDFQSAPLSPPALLPVFSYSAGVFFDEDCCTFLSSRTGGCGSPGWLFRGGGGYTVGCAMCD